LSTATLIVLWWTSKPMYFTLSMGVPFVRRSYCCSQQLQPTPKGAPFYIAWPTFNDLCVRHSHCVGIARKIKGPGRPPDFSITVSSNEAQHIPT
jgi:hypothetical protein